MDEFSKSLITAIATLLIGGILSILLARIAALALEKLTRRTKSETDDFIAKAIVRTIRRLGWLISISITWKILPVGVDIDTFVMGTAKLYFLILIVRLINTIVLRLIQRWSLRIDDPAVSTMLRSLGPMFRALVWCLGLLFYLQNMGVQMAAIWALLSAGGIGAGLALKEPVEEFFEYITILLDKPFQNGEFIHVNDVWATVERVGVRSTRLRSINGEVIVMSNSSLTNGTVSNYAEMEYRRLIHRLGVVYETKHSRMQVIPGILKSIVDKTEDAIFDRCHFVEFNSCSLDFELVYYIPTNDYVRAMKAQEEINLMIIKRFEEESIEFAFPTQTIHLANNEISK